ncbi:hypothetical protein GYMLUDRAFT_90851 [Collybiopsis luxurians FD-317 M1]|nr:hypothetical protein GYMLUDRAFT_90851 [Collybiopsis luxurians FD-317 M1]
MSLFFYYLLHFFFISSALSASPTSPNDQFRAISLLENRQPELPVCCLIPLPPVEPVQEQVLLSFEEWKEKQAKPNKVPQNQTTLSPGNETDPDNVYTTPTEIPDTSSSSTSSTDSDVEKVSPHFQVPLTDRFNYASMDCSARVHLAHRSAKSPSSILSSKRDRYMLSPCNSPNENQFVVVELCEDIRIDTVQLANFEFFSGVFKDFTVSVAKTYKEDWVTVGSYKAKNVRGVQSFHPPPSLTDFYRFIRIDFHTHYSNEYYCPISLLRVYGLTHLEEWKWEIWEAESRAKRGELVEPAKDSVSGPTPLLVASEENVQSSTSSPLPSSDAFSTVQSMSSASASSTFQPTLAPFAWEQFTTSESQITNTHEMHSSINDSPSTTLSSTATIILLPSSNASSASTNATTQSITSIFSSSTTVVQATTSQVHIPLSATGGESIYRTIMNRLTALEANHSLYVRYVEEQTNGVRDMIHRLAEDVGRLEGIGKAQSQIFQRSIKEWENQRKVLETEYNELIARVEYLSDEIVLEKRLGIAQLCLLLAVIIFMGLTRGSRGESLVEHGHLRLNRSMREWSRRHLSFSGDWVSRFTANSRSQSPSLRTAKTPRVTTAQPAHRDDEHKVVFPALSARSRGPKSASHVHAKPQTAITERKPRVQNVYLRSGSRSRTPSLRTPHPHNPRLVSRPTTPTTSISATYRPQLQRANSLSGPNFSLPTSASWTGVGPVPKSAKRWARTAHLHEVKSPATIAAESKIPKDLDEKENQSAESSADSLTIAKSAPDRKAKNMENGMDMDIFFKTPSRLPKRSNGHTRLSVLTTSLDKSSGGLDPRLSHADIRWTTSPGGSCDGEDGDLWIDTDMTDTSIDGDGGLGFDDDEK